jgi:hypothetical protein
LSRFSCFCVSFRLPYAQRVMRFGSNRIAFSAAARIFDICRVC